MPFPSRGQREIACVANHASNHAQESFLVNTTRDWRTTVRGDTRRKGIVCARGSSVFSGLIRAPEFWRNSLFGSVGVK